MSLFKYPKDMIEPLRAHWEDWARYESDPPPLPNDDVLALLLEVAYHASFTADERRGTQFRAIVCNPGDPDVERPLRIEPPRPFTPHEIMRLAPAAASAALAVDVSGSSPVIWGFCDGARMQFTMSVSAPGMLHSGRNHRAIVALEEGRIFQEYERLGVFQPIIEFFDDATEALWEGIAFEVATWNPKIDYPHHLYKLLDAVKQKGHGGAVLVIPDGEWQSPLWRELVRMKYECNDDSIWPHLKSAVQRYNQNYVGDHVQDQYRFDSAEQAAEVLFARLSGLTAVDGALLITDRYRVLGFGVEVVAQAPIDTIRLADGSSRNVEAYGTRHRSAFRFCTAYPRGAAFVCSQDGAVKCIRNRNGRLTLDE